MLKNNFSRAAKAKDGVGDYTLQWQEERVL